MNDTILQQLLLNAKSQQNRYDALIDYYTGYHDILDRTFSDSSKPNNKCVNNFASYIIDVRAGYFTGLPITYNSDNDLYLRDIQSITNKNNDGDTTNELDKLTNIHGHAFELFWIDEDGEIRYKYIPASEMIAVYSSDISETMIYAIRHYKVEDIMTTGVYSEYVEVYSPTSVTEYKFEYEYDADNYTLEPVAQYPHVFGKVPVIEYLNNAERTSSIEDVITLIDAYNVAQSDSVNEVQYFNDAYLVLKNLDATDDSDVADMKNNRIMKVQGDGDAKWLTKQIQDAYIEHLKQRISDDVHKFSKTPNLVSDEFVSNLSGTAIRYKVWGLEQDTASKERKWRKSLKQRIEFLTDYLNVKGKNYDHTELTITFNRNMPQNTTELGQLVSQLAGTVSKETLLGQIPFVEDVKRELTLIKQEEQEAQEQQLQMMEQQQQLNQKYSTGQEGTEEDNKEEKDNGEQSKQPKQSE